MKILLIIGLSLLSGFLYLMGSRYQKLIKKLGCPLSAIGVLLIKGVPLTVWTALIMLGMLITGYIVCGTYWKGDAPDVLKGHWVLTSLGWGAFALPWAFYTGNWIGFVVRCAILVIFVPWWSEKFSTQFAEDFPKGVVFTGSMFLC